MALFKQSRDQMKADALMSQLEFTNRLFNPKDMFRAKFHFSAAQKALVVLRKAEGEYVLSAKGWQYVGRLCLDIKAKSQLNGFDQTLVHEGDEIIVVFRRELRRALRHVQQRSLGVNDRAIAQHERIEHVMQVGMLNSVHR